MSQLTLTSNAKSRIKEICAEGEFLRISLIGGGCHGFSYKFEISSTQSEDDFFLFDEKETPIVGIKKSFLEKLSILELDFKKNLTSAYFTLESPNFASKCGCGTSFAIV